MRVARFLFVVVGVTFALLIARAPAAEPARDDAHDWPAFHGGGALRGESGAPLGPPPMKVRWEYVTNEDDPAPIEGSAAIVGDTVYVGDGTGTLHAIDLATGKSRWTYVAGESGFATTPLVAGGRVMLGDLAGTFHAVDATSGKKLWAVETTSEIHSSANADGERVVFGTDAAEIYCVNAADGKPYWTAKAGDRVNSAPAIVDALALVSGCDAKLRAFDLKDGAERYAADLGALTGGSPAVVEDRLVVGTDAGRVVCLSTDGKPLWTYEGVASKAMVYSSPAVSDAVVLVGARDRQVHALDLKTGQRRWTFRTRGDVDSSPAISNGRVYVGSKDKKLYVLDLQTGRELWSFSANRGIVAGPSIGRGVVVFGDSGGTVYCLEPG